MPKKKPTGSFADMILDIFEEETVKLDEGIIPITPFIAFTAFKKQAFNALKSSGAFEAVRKAKRAPTELKAKAQIGAEKAKVAVGAKPYRLTKEQMSVMADIFEKYGKGMSRDILSFRRNILAPYQLIKRKIAKSSRVSGKDITGLSKEEFRSSLESGRKKIQSRGPEYLKKSQNLQDRIAENSEQIKNLQKIKNDFEGDTPKIDYNITNKVFRDFDIGESLEGYSREELKKVYDDIMKNYRALVRETDKGTVSDFESTKKLVKKSRKLWAGKTIDLTKAEEGEFYKKGSFDAALGKYFFSREILRQLTQPGVYNIFKDTYKSIITEMIKRAKKNKENNLQKLISMRAGRQLTDKEKKIWEQLPTSKKFTGNIEDFFQKIKEEDFPDKPITITRSPELVKAEQKIENEIKKFERKLKTILDEEDFNELKRFRLIGSLISMKELKDPKSLFKSEKQLQQLIPSSETEKKEGEKKGTYLTKEAFYRRIKEIATIEYDRMAELENAKKEAKKLAQQMKDQGDEETVEEYADILRKISRRRTPESKELRGHGLEKSFIVDIDDVEELAKEILQKDYESIDRLKQDNQRLNDMVERYKKADPGDSERNLKEIEFLFGRITRKIATAKTKLQ